MKSSPRFLLLPLLLAAFAAPAWSAPCAGFADVDDTSAFCTSIGWMRNRAITLGCVPDGTLYCPADYVRRDQMAAFMLRMSNALFPSTCATGQVMKWNGAAWACADDGGGTGGGGGTVTSVATGPGLTGGTITTSGTLAVAPAFRLPQTCANGQVAKSSGPGGTWTCANDLDTNAGGTVTSVTAGTGLTGGTITTSGTLAVNTTAIQARVTGACAAGSSIRTINADGSVVCQPDAAGPANAFVQGGNAFGVPAVIGTTDDQPVSIHAGGQRALRLESFFDYINVIGGYPGNSMTGSPGGVIAGGGFSAQNCQSSGVTRACSNLVTNSTRAVVGGGAGHRVQAAGDAVIAGGFVNTASAPGATVSGGAGNAANGYYSVVAGGLGNVAGNVNAFVAGGNSNRADGAVAFAAGNRANAARSGCFVWSDNSSTNYTSCFADNEFIARALGGFYFFTSGSSDANYAGAALATGSGAWANYSDRAGKENFAAVDPVDVVRTLASVPIATWNWRAQDGAIRHMGPTAQDFHAAFGLGESDRMINSVDTDGVALAAIQGLYKLVGQREDEIAALRRELEAMKRVVERLAVPLDGPQRR